MLPKVCERKEKKKDCDANNSALRCEALAAQLVEFGQGFWVAQSGYTEPECQNNLNIDV